MSGSLGHFYFDSTLMAAGQRMMLCINAASNARFMYREEEKNRASVEEKSAENKCIFTFDA